MNLEITQIRCRSGTSIEISFKLLILSLSKLLISKIPKSNNKSKVG